MACRKLKKDKVMVQVRTEILFPTKHGVCKLYSFKGLSDSKEHIALIFGDGNINKTPLVRIHSECKTGDVFGSKLCDCGEQLNEAVSLFSKRGGIIIYLQQEGRNIGLYNKIDTYAIQAKGYDTYEANEILNFPRDARDFKVAAEILIALGIKKIKLLSNNPKKYEQLIENGIDIVSRKNTNLYINNENKNYLEAKIKKGGHIFNFNCCKEAL